MPGGGLGNRAYPYWHAVNLAKNMETKKWFSFCTSYSSKLQRIHQYQDGLKVFSFQFTDEKEDPLFANTFSKIEIGGNMRGLFTDLNIYSSYFDDKAMADWTAGCFHEDGDIFRWEKDKIDINQGQDSQINVSIIKMAKADVCPDKKAKKAGKKIIV